jgi:hypothetical protein
MDNLGNNSLPLNDQPIPLDDKANEPGRPEDNPAGGSPGVSRAPLNLGGAAGGPAPAAAPGARAPASLPKAPTATPRPVAAPRPAAAAAAGERITACRTFFTKLHPGAIKFVEEQITNWLKENPRIVVKSTNVIMGEVQEKKTEPNIIIVVWY